MARREITGRKLGQDVVDDKDTVDDEPVAYTIKEFCAAHRISPSAYYELKKQGLGPREADVGRFIVTREAARDWRRQREAETTTA